ncbi:hypothetical protein TRIP_E30028 [uncultured Spirochaetota bacterium]|uniref:Uncharacterized protein n=1 Tax=uncultured Spirochaetota bacterium TaxID=460511 RepID=A0A652ZXE7_9SPIR|nr:hypothetical protein TRIP_E30028 [uncultured Spirochaetota bacterium]
MPFLSREYRMNTSEASLVRPGASADRWRVNNKPYTAEKPKTLNFSQLCNHRPLLCNMPGKPVLYVGNHLILVEFVDRLVPGPFIATGFEIDDPQGLERLNQAIETKPHPDNRIAGSAKEVDRQVGGHALQKTGGVDQVQAIHQIGVKAIAAHEIALGIGEIGVDDAAIPGDPVGTGPSRPHRPVIVSEAHVPGKLPGRMNPENPAPHGDDQPAGGAQEPGRLFRRSREHDAIQVLAVNAAEPHSQKRAEGMSEIEKRHPALFFRGEVPQLHQIVQYSSKSILVGEIPSVLSGIRIAMAAQIGKIGRDADSRQGLGKFDIPSAVIVHSMPDQHHRF